MSSWRGPDAVWIAAEYRAHMAARDLEPSAAALGDRPPEVDYGAPPDTAWFQPGTDAARAQEARRAEHTAAYAAWKETAGYAAWIAACEAHEARARQYAFGLKREQYGATWAPDGVGKASADLANLLAFVGELRDAPTKRAPIGKARAPKRGRPAIAPAAAPAVESHAARLRRLARQLNDLQTEYHAAILAAMQEGHGASATARDAGMTRQGVYAVVKRAA